VKLIGAALDCRPPTAFSFRRGRVRRDIGRRRVVERIRGAVLGRPCGDPPSQMVVARREVRRGGIAFPSTPTVVFRIIGPKKIAD
jgi:hypothetical protein